MEIFSLKNKNALVCGSTQGIGKAIAKMLAEHGAHVYLMARNEEKLKAMLGENENYKGYLVADFSDNSQVQNALNSFDKKNEIDILVNNTGGPPSGLIQNATPQEFLNAFQSHLINNHLLVQAVIEGMKTRQNGRIVNIISTSVKIPLPNLGVSNTIRAAVANWSKTMANELAAYNATVNNVLPGATYTQRLESIIHTKADKTGHTDEEISQDMIAEIPMRRFGKSEEIAAAVAFLVSPAASYITGINLPVDGGRTGSL